MTHTNNLVVNFFLLFSGYPFFLDNMDEIHNRCNVESLLRASFTILLYSYGVQHNHFRCRELHRSGTLRYTSILHFWKNWALQSSIFTMLYSDIIICVAGTRHVALALRTYSVSSPLSCGIKSISCLKRAWKYKVGCPLSRNLIERIRTFLFSYCVRHD